MSRSFNKWKVSLDNATSALLTAWSSYTGTWEDVSWYNSVLVAIKTDQNGSFVVQFSPDWTNIDSSLTRYYRTTQIEAPHRFTITRKYFRIVFINDSSVDQTYLRLQCLLWDKEALNVPIDWIVAQDYDATVVRPTSHTEEVALGLRQGWSIWNKWGYNTSISSGTETTVASMWWRLTPLTSAETFDIAYDWTTWGSTDGAWTNWATVLGFWYVDDNREQAYSEHTLWTDWTDTTSFSGFWINRVKVVQAGSGRVNANDITITSTTSATNQAHVPAWEWVTQQAFFFTPLKHKFLADWIHINMVKIDTNNKPTVILRWWVKDYVNNVDYEIFRETIDTTVQNNFELRPKEPFLIPEGSVLEFTAETDINWTEVSIRFSWKLVKDVDA